TTIKLHSKFIGPNIPHIFMGLATIIWGLIWPQLAEFQVVFTQNRHLLTTNGAFIDALILVINACG
ncbi:hypothetical protein A9Q73_06370, partial [Bermanella sp. 47_1433_sub80_T6]